MKTFVALSALAAVVFAQNLPTSVTEAQVERVEQEYNNSGFNTALPNSQSFEEELDGEGILSVTYSGTTLVNGQDYAATAVAAMPEVTFTPLADDAANFNSSAAFTLILADASAVGGPDAEGDYRHYLANSVQFVEGTGALTLDTSHSSIITSYAGPGPLPGSGVHRYAWLLFQQGEDFQAPAGLAEAGVAPSHWSVHDYVESANLGDLVGATFFTVTAEGTASFSAGSTSAPASASSTSSSSVGPATTSGTSNQAGQSSSSGASSLQAGFASLVGLALAFVVFA